MGFILLTPLPSTFAPLLPFTSRVGPPSLCFDWWQNYFHPVVLIIPCDDGNECASLRAKPCRFSHSLCFVFLFFFYCGLSSKQFAGAKNKEELVRNSQSMDYNSVDWLRKKEGEGEGNITRELEESKTICLHGLSSLCMNGYLCLVCMCTCTVRRPVYLIVQGFCCKCVPSN